MARLVSAVNPYIERTTINHGYELCSRCGHPILNGDSAYVMWRAPEYGAFAHTFQCSTKKPRNWTQILKYEQANETILWNSERVPEIVTPLTSNKALATLPAETRKFQYERVTGEHKNTLRKNRYEWVWTPGDPNWKRIDHWNDKGEWVSKGTVDIDFIGGSSTVVIAGRTFPFVSLLDWGHIQNAVSIVDIELTKEYPAKYPNLGQDHDETPLSETVRQTTAVAMREDDDKFAMSGLVPVTRRIVCQNREERKMMERLCIMPLYDFVESAARRGQYHRGENARDSIGRRQEIFLPRPESIQVSFLKPVVTRALERIIYATTIRNERARSYGTGRRVEVDPLPLYFTGWAKELRTRGNELYTRKPKVTKNGPGTSQSWDALGRVVERAFYCDPLIPILDHDGRRRLATHPEYVEWELRPRQPTLSEVPPRKDDPSGWVRSLKANPTDLLALVSWWMQNLDGGAYDRPWIWMRRETDVLCPETIGEAGHFLPVAGIDSSSVTLALEGA
jgi:hypothetical protein